MLLQVDGLSGSGKSSLVPELESRGYRAVDADSEFAYFGDPNTGQPTDVQIRDNWIWHLAKLNDLAESSSAIKVFVCGGALNQEVCAHLFAARFLLTIDNETMRRRLLARADGYGRTPHELAEQLRLNETSEKEGRRAGRMIVGATQPLAAVAN